LSERIADAEAGLDAEKKNCRSKFEKRKARITQAHLTCNRQVMEGTDREGRQKHWLQKSTVDAERNRDAGLANAAATLDNFKIKLAESREIFALLEKTPVALFAVTANSAGCWLRNGNGRSRIFPRMKINCLTSFIAWSPKRAMI
jgi:hypothetical protein